MQHRTFKLQGDVTDVEEAPDPLKQHADALRSTHIPVLLASGERDMPDFKQAAREFAAILPNSRSVVIAGAAHLAPLETPNQFRRLVLEFFASELPG